MRPRDVTPSTHRALACLVVALGLGSALSAVLAPAGALASDAPDRLGDVGCPDPLVVHRPDGSAGDQASVAITTQVVERGVPGWASVGWEAAPGTTLSAVLVTTPDGVERRPGDASGVAYGVLELAFCGRHGPTSADAPRTEDAEETRDTGGTEDTEDTEERTAPVRFDAPRDDRAGGTATPALLGAAVGFTAGAVVLLMSRTARRDREARR